MNDSIDSCVPKAQLTMREKKTRTTFLYDSIGGVISRPSKPLEMSAYGVSRAAPRQEFHGLSVAGTSAYDVVCDL